MLIISAGMHALTPGKEGKAHVIGTLEKKEIFVSVSGLTGVSTYRVCTIYRFHFLLDDIISLSCFCTKNRFSPRPPPYPIHLLQTCN